MWEEFFSLKKLFIKFIKTKTESKYIIEDGNN